MRAEGRRFSDRERTTAGGPIAHEIPKMGCAAARSAGPSFLAGADERR
jgi:hypothetical protein